VVQISIYIITAAIALAGLYDFVKDELEHRRSRASDSPKTRKRVAQVVAVVGSILLAILTWLDGRENEREEAELRARIAQIAGVQREMDRASNAVVQARNGIRAGIDTLQTLALESRSPEIRTRTNALLESVRTDYDRSLDRGMKETGVKTRVELLGYYGLPVDMANQPITLPVIVQIIRSDQDLHRVACAFAAFAELTATDTQVFDFHAVEKICTSAPSWCERAAM
jgi:hypothetical protein